MAEAQTLSERLRAGCVTHWSMRYGDEVLQHSTDSLLSEAADEIDRLQQELARTGAGWQ